MEENNQTGEPQVSSVKKSSDNSLTMAVQKMGIKGMVGLTVVILVIFAGVLMSVMVYKKPATDPLVRKIVNIFPYPAGSLNGQSILMRDFASERVALNTFFANQDPSAVPSSEELDAGVMDTLVNKIVISELAKEYDVTLDQEKVDELYNELISGQQTEEQVVEELKSTYGWGIEEFRSRVLEAVVLAMQVGEKVATDESIQGEQRGVIQMAKERLDNGDEFGTVAQDLSEGPSASTSGDIGFIPKDTLQPEWTEFVSSAEPGDVSEILEGDIGYTIIRLEEWNEEETEAHLSMIFTHKVTLEEVVEDYLAGANEVRYVGKKEEV